MSVLRCRIGKLEYVLIYWDSHPETSLRRHHDIIRPSHVENPLQGAMHLLSELRAWLAKHIHSFISICCCLLVACDLAETSEKGPRIGDRINQCWELRLTSRVWWMPSTCFLIEAPIAIPFRHVNPMSHGFCLDGFVLFSINTMLAVAPSLFVNIVECLCISIP